jgi:hypothetical protein
MVMNRLDLPPAKFDQINAVILAFERNDKKLDTRDTAETLLALDPSALIANSFVTALERSGFGAPSSSPFL